MLFYNVNDIKNKPQTHACGRKYPPRVNMQLVDSLGAQNANDDD